MNAPTSEEFLPSWQVVTNSDTIAIPPFAAVQVDGFATDNTLRVKRPTADNLSSVMFVNMGGISVGGKGMATFFTPQVALTRVSDGAAAPEDSWGTKANLFTLVKNNTGFTCVAAVSSQMALFQRSGSGGTSGAPGCGWTAGLITADCLIASYGGASIILTSTDGATWTSTGSLTICGTAYTVKVSKANCAQVCVTLTSAGAGSGAAPIYGTLGGCSCNVATASFPARTLCPSSTRPTTGACYDTVDIKITYSRCPIANWAGDGWYCVAAAGHSCSEAVALYLQGDDQYDQNIQICSGPYANQAAANAVCGPVTPITMSCGGNSYTIPSAIFAKFTNATAPLGTVRLVWNGTDHWYAPTLPTGCGTHITDISWDPCFGLTISGTDIQTFSGLRYNSPGCASAMPAGFCGFTTSPFRYAGVGTIVGGGPCNSGTSIGQVEITPNP